MSRPRPPTASAPRSPHLSLSPTQRRWRLSKKKSAHHLGSIAGTVRPGLQNMHVSCACCVLLKFLISGIIAMPLLFSSCSHSMSEWQWLSSHEFSIRGMFCEGQEDGEGEGSHARSAFEISSCIRRHPLEDRHPSERAFIPTFR